MTINQGSQSSTAIIGKKEHNFHSKSSVRHKAGPQISDRQNITINQGQRSQFVAPLTQATGPTLSLKIKV